MQGYLTEMDVSDKIDSLMNVMNNLKDKGFSSSFDKFSFLEITKRRVPDFIEKILEVVSLSSPQIDRISQLVYQIEKDGQDYKILGVFDSVDNELYDMTLLFAEEIDSIEGFIKKFAKEWLELKDGEKCNIYLN